MKYTLLFSSILLVSFTIVSPRGAFADSSGRSGGQVSASSSANVEASEENKISLKASDLDFTEEQKQILRQTSDRAQPCKIQSNQPNDLEALTRASNCFEGAALVTIAAKQNLTISEYLVHEVMDIDQYPTAQRYLEYTKLFDRYASSPAPASN